jgi:aconitate hydratase
MPAGARVLPFRSNIPEISKFAFNRIDESFYDRALPYQKTGCFVVAGYNYGQGSSREHAALAPRFLGLKAVLAKSFARIHRQNLINFGILALTFSQSSDWEKINRDDELEMPDVRSAIQEGTRIKVLNKTRNQVYQMEHSMSARQIEMMLEGSLINVVRKKHNRLKIEN